MTRKTPPIILLHSTHVLSYASPNSYGCEFLVYSYLGNFIFISRGVVFIFIYSYEFKFDLKRNSSGKTLT